MTPICSEAVYKLQKFIPERTSEQTISYLLMRTTSPASRLSVLLTLPLYTIVLILWLLMVVWGKKSNQLFLRLIHLKSSTGWSWVTIAHGYVKYKRRGVASPLNIHHRMWSSMCPTLASYSLISSFKILQAVIILSSRRRGGKKRMNIHTSFPCLGAVLGNL